MLSGYAKLGAMSQMLPSHSADAVRLAEVFASCSAAVRGEANQLNLPAVRSAIIVVVDGLGLHNLRGRAGHARTLMSAVTSKSVAVSTFPSTTASALTTLTTGVEPGQHGIVAYAIRDSTTGSILNQLTGWGPAMPSDTWQRAETEFERLAATGLRADAVGHPKFAQSGFTQAVLRGSHYVPAASMTERLERAVAAADEPGVSYVYVSELDMAAHAFGWESAEWLAQLEACDSAIRASLRTLPAHVGLVVTADHGIVDVPAHRQLLIDQSAPELLGDVVGMSGDPRALSLWLEPSASTSERKSLAAQWRDRIGDQAWAVSREEAIEAGLYGVVDPAVVARIGDVLLIARKQIALYDSRSASSQSRAMIGQHGALTDEERRVPVLRFGAFD